MYVGGGVHLMSKLGREWVIAVSTWKKGTNRLATHVNIFVTRYECKNLFPNGSFYIKRYSFLGPT